MKKYNLYIFLLFIFVGCDHFTRKINNQIASQNNKVSNSIVNNELKFCKNPNKQILLADKNFINSYNDLFNRNLFKNKNFVERAVNFSMIELISKPEKISISSRLQVIMKYEGKYFYFDFRPKNLNTQTTYPFLYGQKYLLEKFTKSSLISSANEIDRSLDSSLNVSDSLELFIKSYQKEAIKDTTLAQYFLKADEPITKFETFNKQPISKLIQNLKTKNLLSDIDYYWDQNELNFKANENKTNINCNFNINSEIETKNSLTSVENEVTHFFGYKENDNYYYAIASAIINHPLSSLESSYFLNFSPAIAPIPLCLLENKKNKIYISSLEGKFKNQFLKHLIDYEIYNSESIDNIYDQINFPRHLFLSNPDRILYESKRGRKDQLDFFLTMNFPIYHVDKIGNISGVYERLTNKQIYLFTDERNKSSATCLK